MSSSSRWSLTFAAETSTCSGNPLGEPAVRGPPVHRERGGQLAPRAAGLQYVQDRREHRPVIGTPPTATLMPLRMPWQQRPREMPQGIRTVLLHVTHTPVNE